MLGARDLSAELQTVRVEPSGAQGSQGSQNLSPFAVLMQQSTVGRTSGYMAPTAKGVPAKRLKAHPPEFPPVKFEEMETINNFPSGSGAVVPQALVVVVDDDLANEILASGDKELCYSLSVIPGFYWLVPHNYDGRPVWKQEFPVGPSTSALVLFFYDGKAEPGWYISDKVWSAPKTREADKVKSHLWLGQNESPSHTPHFPFWSKKPTEQVKIMSFVDYMAAEMLKLQSTIDEQQLLLEYPKGSDEDALSPQNQEVAPEDAPEQAQGSRGGKSGKQQTRGGWMPKMARAMVAFYSKRWHNLKKHFDQAYYEHQTLRQLVDTGLQLQG